MSMGERLNTAMYTAQRSPIREFSNLAARTPDCVRLTLGEPDFDTPAPIRAAVGEALEAGETHYITNNGVMSLRERIALYEAEHHGLRYEAGDVIVTAGATEAIFVALFGILNPGDEVIIPCPGFVLYREIVNLCRGVTVSLNTEQDGFQIRSGALEPLITPRTKAIVLNSPHNPTGCIYDEESLAAVRRAVKGTEIFVLCDDVYRDLHYTETFRSFAEFSDLRPQILAVQGFSKAWAMTGWRMGWLLADAPVRERLELIHQYAVTSTPAPFQRAAMAALEVDPSPMREVYRARRALALEGLAALGLDAPRPDGAFYLFPSIEKYGMDSTSFCTGLLQSEGVALTPGAAFGCDGRVRLSYCCPEEQLREGLRRLGRFLNRLEAEGHA